MFCLLELCQKVLLVILHVQLLRETVFASKAVHAENAIHRGT